MPYFVYMLITNRKGRFISYVGYTSNLKKRLIQHNNSKGAKFTKGSRWNLIFKKKYAEKNQAMKGEYKLKKDYKLRSKLKCNYINK